jgi:hypothetical protein
VKYGAPLGSVGVWMSLALGSGQLKNLLYCACVI